MLIKLLILFLIIKLGKKLLYSLPFLSTPKSHHTTSFCAKCGFETDQEITAKLINHGIQIIEVPVKYSPRSFEEGKKIKMRDGFVALWTFFRFRFINSVIITKKN